MEKNSINKGKNKCQTQTNLLNLVKIFKTRNHKTLDPGLIKKFYYQPI